MQVVSHADILLDCHALLPNDGEERLHDEFKECLCGRLTLGRTDGRTDRRTERRMNGWMNGMMDRRADGWMDGWLDGWMDGWTSSIPHTPILLILTFYSDYKLMVFQQIKSFSNDFKAIHSKKKTLYSFKVSYFLMTFLGMVDFLLHLFDVEFVSFSFLASNM